MVKAYYTTRWSSCSSPPWRHTLTHFTGPSDHGCPRAIVFVFFGSFVFGITPGAWSPGVSNKQSVSFFVKYYGFGAMCLSNMSRLPSHSSGFLCEVVSFFFLQFLLEKRIRSCSSSRLSIYYYVTEAPVMQEMQFSQVVLQVLNTLATCPLLVTTIFELDSVVLQRFALAVLRWFLTSPSLRSRPVLVLQYIFEYIISFRKFFAHHTRFGFLCRCGYMLIVCYR